MKRLSEKEKFNNRRYKNGYSMEAISVFIQKDTLYVGYA